MALLGSLSFPLIVPLHGAFRDLRDHSNEGMQPTIFLKASKLPRRAYDPCKDLRAHLRPKCELIPRGAITT